MHHFFGFNDFAYYFVAFLLRVLAGFAIGAVIWTFKPTRYIALLTAFFFMVSVPGIESSSWVSHFIVYAAITTCCAFIICWKRFHEKPSILLLVLISLFFFITLFLSPIRLFGLPLIFLLGESYFFIKNFNDKRGRLIRILNFVCVACIAILLYFKTTMFVSTSELSVRGADIFILTKTLFSGSPPIIMTLILFLSNVVSPSYTFSFLATQGIPVNSITLLSVTIILTLISLSCFIFFARKHCWKLTLATVIPIIFPTFIDIFMNKYTTENLFWNKDYHFFTLVTGGTVFFLIMIILCYQWQKDRKIAELGFLGFLLSFIHLLLPWYIAPYISSNAQSAYDLTNRYYTVPSFGMSLVWASILLIAAKKILSKNSALVSKFVSYTFLLIFILILFIQSLTIHDHFNQRLSYLNLNSHTKLWNDLTPHLHNLSDYNRIIILFTGQIDANVQYMREELPYKIPYELGYIYNNPEIYVVSNNTELQQYLLPSLKIKILKFIVKNEHLIFIK